MKKENPQKSSHQASVNNCGHKESINCGCWVNSMLVVKTTFVVANQWINHETTSLTHAKCQIPNLHAILPQIL